MLRYLVKGPTNYQWGRDDVPKDTEIPDEIERIIPDDIERIRHFRNRVCHSDASEIDTSIFNESVLELLGVIHDNSKFVRHIFKIYKHPKKIFFLKVPNAFLITG